MIKTGAIAGLSSVILVLLLAQSRGAFSLARDGLLPKAAHRVHPRFHTPHVSSMVLGSFVAVAAAVVPIHDAASLVSIGTLFAFLVVTIALLVLRSRRPDFTRPFRTPFVYVVAPLTVVSTLYLMVALGPDPWWRLLSWGLLGLVIYFGYGVRNSSLARASRDHA